MTKKAEVEGNVLCTFFFVRQVYSSTNAQSYFFNSFFAIMVIEELILQCICCKLLAPDTAQYMSNALESACNFGVWWAPCMFVGLIQGVWWAPCMFV